MNPETNSKAWVPTRWYKLVRDSPSLSWRAKSAAAVLASYMDNRSGTCTPSLGTIAAGMGRAEETAKRGTRELVEGGVLARKRRFNQSSIYTAMFPVQVSADPTVGAGQLAPDQVPPDLITTHLVVIDSKELDASRVPEPSVLEDTSYPFPRPLV